MNAVFGGFADEEAAEAAAGRLVLTSSAATLTAESGRGAPFYMLFNVD